MNASIIPATTFNRLNAAEQLAALRTPVKKEHNWHNHNIERRCRQNRRMEALVEYNASQGVEEGEILWVPSNWQSIR